MGMRRRRKETKTEKGIGEEEHTNAVRGAKGGETRVKDARLKATRKGKGEARGRAVVK